jgi:hypothetical protein
MPYTLFQGGRKRQSGWVRAVLACVTVAVCAAGGLLLFLGETRW